MRSAHICPMFKKGSAALSNRRWNFDSGITLYEMTHCNVTIVYNTILIVMLTDESFESDFASRNNNVKRDVPDEFTLPKVKFRCEEKKAIF